MPKEPWEASATQFEKIKELIVKWMKPIPADCFFACDEAPCFEGNENAWEYKPRYIKSCYLQGLLNLKHISKIPEYLEYAPHASSADYEVTAVFLCSKTAMKNAETVKPLIEFIDNDDVYEKIKHNYELLIRSGIKGLYFPNNDFKLRKKKGQYFTIYDKDPITNHRIDVEPEKIVQTAEYGCMAFFFLDDIIGIKDLENQALP